MTAGPVLETPRLILRPTRAEDLDGYVELMSDDDHVRFIGGAAPPSTVWRQMMTVAGAWALQGFAFFSVIEKESGRWVGRLGPWEPHGWPGHEIGWSILKSEAGKGYVTEGSATFCDAMLSGAMQWITSSQPSVSKAQSIAAAEPSVT